MKCPKCGSTNNTPIKLKDGRNGAQCNDCGCKMAAKKRPTESAANNTSSELKLNEESKQIQNTPVVIPLHDEKKENNENNKTYNALFPKITDDIFALTGIDCNGFVSKAIAKAHALFDIFKSWIKQPLSIVASIIIAFLLLITVTSNSQDITYDNSYDKSKEHSITKENVSSEAVLPAIITVSDSDIIEADYTYLVNNPTKYSEQNKYIRVAGYINKISLSEITFKTTDDDEVNVYTQLGCDLSKYDEGMYVTLIGKYKDSSYNSVSLSDGYIEEQGDRAKSTYERLSAEGDKLRAADKKAAEEKAKKTKKEYMAACKTYKYKDIARNPDKYTGKKAKFTGKVVQVQESSLYTVLRVNVTKGKYGIYDDTMYVTYFSSSDSSRILEDDIVTIYGELAGIKTYETVLGASVSIPQIDAEYITINS